MKYCKTCLNTGTRPNSFFSKDGISEQLMENKINQDLSSFSNELNFKINSELIRNHERKYIIIGKGYP